MIGSIDMWSDQDQAVVAWSVALVEEKDEGDNVVGVLLLTHGTEEQRYSPNTTEYELTRYADNANTAHGVAHSHRESAALEGKS